MIRVLATFRTLGSVLLGFTRAILIFEGEEREGDRGKRKGEWDGGEGLEKGWYVDRC